MPAPLSVWTVRSTTWYSSGFWGASVGSGVSVGRGDAVGEAWSIPRCTATTRSMLQDCRTGSWVQWWSCSMPSSSYTPLSMSRRTSWYSSAIT